MKRLHCALSLTFLGLLPGAALAQTGDAKVTQFVADGALKNGSDAKKQGWDFTLTLSANLAIAQSSNVVGQPEGVSYLIGLGATGGLEYLDGPHEWKNTLSIIESFSKTPALDQVTKANDVARLESIYSYYFTGWAGAFGRGSLETAILNTQDIRATPVDYVISRGNPDQETLVGRKLLTLAKAFAPLTLTESLGLVAKPIDVEPAVVTIRVGGGGRETLASGVLIVKSAAANVVDVARVSDVIQAGVEGAIGVAGKFPAERITYGADFGILFPFANNDTTGRSAVDLMRVGFAAALNFSMFDWLGLTYQFRVQSDPQLVKDVQVQNNFFLTFKYDVVPPRKVVEEPKADPVADAKAAAAAAEERAKAAEDRAKAAEDKLKAAEDKAKEVPPPPPAPEASPAPTPP
ncbi:MAG: hypothetical protein U1E65_33705 [Myxococcota bacterium]